MDGSKYLTAKQVQTRYGSKSRTWLYLKKNDPNFPKPTYIGRSKYFLIADLDAYDKAQMTNEAPSAPERTPECIANARAVKRARAGADRSEAANPSPK